MEPMFEEIFRSTIRDFFSYACEWNLCSGKFFVVLFETFFICMRMELMFEENFRSTIRDTFICIAMELMFEEIFRSTIRDILQLVCASSRDTHTHFSRDRCVTHHLQLYFTHASG